VNTVEKSTKSARFFAWNQPSTFFRNFLFYGKNMAFLPPPTGGTGAGKTKKVWWYLLRILPFSNSLPQENGQGQAILGPA